MQLCSLVASPGLGLESRLNLACKTTVSSSIDIKHSHRRIVYGDNFPSANYGCSLILLPSLGHGPTQCGSLPVSRTGKEDLVTLVMFLCSVGMCSYKLSCEKAVSD